MVVVYGLEHFIADEAENESEDDAAACFDEEVCGYSCDGDVTDACGGDAYEDEVDDDSYAVVEEGFSGDFCF